MSDCYTCDGLRETIKGKNWVIGILVALYLVGMVSCIVQTDKRGMAERENRELTTNLARAEQRAEQNLGAPIETPTGSFRVMACDTTSGLCILAALKANDSGNNWGRLYRLQDIPYNRRPESGHIVAVEQGRLVGLSNIVN